MGAEKPIMKMLIEMGILLIIIFGINYVFEETQDNIYDCGTGYTMNTTARNCMLNTNTTIVKNIPNDFAKGITWIQQVLTAVSLICVMDIIYRGAKGIATTI